MKKLPLFLLAVAVMAVAATPLFSQIIVHKVLDAENLNDFYYATGGEGWRNSTNFPLPDDEFPAHSRNLRAYGLLDYIVVSEQRRSGAEGDTIVQSLRITKVDLTNNSLSGRAGTLNLPELQELNLWGNSLEGIDSIICPKVKSIDISDNTLKHLPIFLTPALVELTISGNTMAGSSIPSVLNFPLLERLDLADNELGGTFPSLEQMPNLQFLWLFSNKLSGNLPPVLPSKLEVLSAENNQITGSIPPYQTSALQHLLLSHNSLSGSIPRLQMPNLVSLRLANNTLEGEPEAMNFPKLQELDLSNNSLSGRLPSIASNELLYLYLQNNEFSGEVTPFYNSKLEDVDISSNKLSGSLPIVHSNNLQYYDLHNNKFSGTVPALDYPNLEWINLSGNQFEGTLDLTNLSSLEAVAFSNTNIERLPSLAFSAPDLEYIDCRDARLHFADIEPYIGNIEIEYIPQQDVDLKVTEKTTMNELSVEVRGSQNRYIWVKLSPSGQEDTLRETGKSIEVEKDEDPTFYRCYISSEVVPYLVLQTASPVKSDCWENEYFLFCAIAGEWEGDEDNKDQISISGTVHINDFLYFDGELQLDTAALAVEANGKFYIPDIPLPGGGVGTFVVAEGDFDLELMGEGGLLTGFLNSALDRVPSIGGLTLNIEDLKLLGGRAANGIELSVKVGFNNLSPGCNTGKPVPANISFKGIKIQTTGIDVGGVQVEDMAFAPGFCLKELGLEYDREEDKLTFGLTVLTPFIEVGGGIQLVGGKLDSIGVKAVLQDHIIPIGTTGIGIIGCSGHVASITSPPFNIRLGGIFSSVLSRDLFELTLSAEYLPPAELRFEAGEGKFFRPPLLDDDWWLAEGGIFGAIDFRSLTMRTGGELSVAPYKDSDGEKDFMAKGSVSLGFRSQGGERIFVGSFGGSVTIPQISTRWPFGWVSRRFGLPYTVAGDGVIVYRDSRKFMNGVLDMGGRVGQIRYIIDFTKSYRDEGFFYFDMQEARLTKQKTEDRSDGFRFLHGFTTTDETSLVVIRVQGTNTLPDVILMDPNDELFIPEMPGNNIEIDSLHEENTVYWTLYSPPSGNWLLLSDGDDDIVEVRMQQPVPELSLEVLPREAGYEVFWNPFYFDAGDSISIGVDDNKSGFDGTLLKTVAAEEGRAFISKEDLHIFCSFYVFALTEGPSGITALYHDEQFALSESGILPPRGMRAVYDHYSRRLDVSWLASPDANALGYVLSLVEGDEEYTLAVLHRSEEEFSTFLDDFKGGRLRISAYGADNTQSCLVEEVDVPVSVEEAFAPALERNGLSVFPNPSSGAFTLRLHHNTYERASIQVLDMMGRVVHSLDKVQLVEGMNSLALRINGLPTGNYLLRLQTDSGTVKSVTIGHLR